MVGTYKYDGKVVSETTFKEKVYGSDSKQAEASRKRDSQKEADKSSAGSKGSSYSKVTRADGSVEIKDSNQKTIETQTAEQQKKTVVVGVGKDSEGNTRVENVGAYLNEEQRREVSKLTSEKGRLSVQELKRSVSVNAQGQREVSQKVSFAYKQNTSSTSFQKTDDQPSKVIQELAQQRFRENPLTHKVVIDEWEFTKVGKTETKTTPAYIGSGGVIEAEEKPKGLFEKIEYFFDTKKEKLISSSEKKSFKQETSFGEGAGLFALGVASGAYNTVKAVVRIDKTAKNLFNFAVGAVKDPSLIVETAKGIGLEFTRNPSGFIGEVVGSAGVFKAVGAGAKAGIKKYKAPKVVSQTKGETLRVDLSDDVAKSTSKSSTIVKSGSKTFKVDVMTKTVDRADDAGVRLQSSKTNFKVSHLDKKGKVITTNKGFGRAEVVASKADDGTVLARGDTVQSVNLNGKSVTRQGDLTSIGKNTDPGSTMTTIVKTGKKVKGKLVKSADDLDFVDDTSKKVSGVESSGSKKILEFDAPKKTTHKTPFGDVTLESKELFKNTLYDDVASARSGSYLTKADKASTLKVDPYSQTTSQSGLSVSFKGFDTLKNSVLKSKVKASDKALKVVQESDNFVLTKTDQGFVLSANKISSKPPLNNPSFASQSVTLVQDIVEKDIVKATKVVDVVTDVAVASKVATVSTTGYAPLKPVTYTKTKGATPVTIAKAKTANKTVVATKTFSSTKVLPKIKTATKSVLDVRTKSKTKTALATKSLTKTALKTQTVQKTTTTQLSAQKIGLSSLTVVKPKPFPFLGLITPKNDFVKQTQSQGFNVFVRERGVFKKVSKTALSKGDARDLGAYNVYNTPRATFTLRASASPLGGISRKVSGSFSAFRSNFLKKGNLFIEKKEKRIKSGGEKAGITRKGILANKNKKFKGFKL